MWKTLVYCNIEYPDFLINQQGQIKNKATNHIYKPTYNSGGYAIITLPMGRRGKVKSIRLHRALAEVFLPNPHNYTVVHHKDSNTSNFQLSNLEWVSQKINIQYSLEERAQETPYFNNRKLTSQDVLDIRKNVDGLSYQQLAIKYNVSKTVISNIMNNKSYIGL